MPNPEGSHISTESELEVLCDRLKAATDVKEMYAVLDKITAYLTTHHSSARPVASRQWFLFDIELIKPNPVVLHRPIEPAAIIGSWPIYRERGFREN